MTEDPWISHTCLKSLLLKMWIVNASSYIYFRQILTHVQLKSFYRRYSVFQISKRYVLYIKSLGLRKSNLFVNCCTWRAYHMNSGVFSFTMLTNATKKNFKDHLLILKTWFSNICFLPNSFILKLSNIFLSSRYISTNKILR